MVGGPAFSHHKMIRGYRLYLGLQRATADEGRANPTQEGNKVMRIGALAVSLFAFISIDASATTISADADVYVQGGTSGNQNFDFATDPVRGVRVFAKNDSAQADGPFDYASYIRFNVSALSGTITSARLDLTISAISPSGFSPNFQGYSLYVMDDAQGDSWDETAVTWFNGPTSIGDNDPQNATFIEELTFSVPPAPTVGSVLSFSSANLANVLNNSVGADGLITFILEDSRTASNGALFASKEHPTLPGPQLTVSVSSVPAPPSLVLAASIAGLVGLQTYRRNRRC